MSASFDTARTHTSGPSSSSSFMGSQHERAGVASAMVPRRVQIQAIPHSTMSSDTLASKTTAATTLPSEMLAYGLPSADNGIPPHYQQPQHHHQQQHEADSGDGRKGTGLRAALASKFTPKKKTKEISRLSVNTERQQHQLESLLSLSKVGDGKEAVGPTVRGQPVGHPMSFQHVEHLSPTLIAPKLALINSSQLYKSSTVQPKSSAGVEKKSHFLGFKPSSLLTKPSKQSLNAGGSSAPVTESVRTVRGKPIGAPSEFKHVDHLSPDEFSTQQYQMLNHRQQQHEIVSVLTQPGGGGAAGERPKTRAATGPSSGSLPKITYRGLPLSGPVTFEHVEHISPKDYHAQLLSAKLAGVAPGSGPGATNELPALPAPATESTSAMPAQPTATAASKFAGSSNGGSARAQRAKQLFTQPLNIKPANSASSKAKAGISKARQISSPFNVQHDVHISVEDLDDIMQQVPDTWKPYISPARSPLSTHHPTSDEAQEDGPAQPLTPIYAAMTSTRRRSTGGSDEEGALTEQIGHLGLSEPRSGADTPGWLPRIVSVCSPPETTPMAYRKQRAASDQELDTQIRRASADPHLRNARGPSTPTSAPIAPALIEEGVAFTYQVPDSPLSTRSAGAITSTAPPVTAAAAAAMPGSRMPTIVAPTATLSAVEPRTSPGAANALATSKWIKRKSRIMPSTRFSVAPQGLVQAIAEDDEEEAAGDPVKTPTLGVEDGLAAMQARSTSQSSHAATLSSATAVSAAAGAAGESKSSKRRRENYGQLEEYAEGESGNVYITTWTGTGKRPKGDYVAVKVVPKAAKARYRKLRTELKILRRIRSQHVVRFYEYFSIDDSVWIIYEFMGRGSITDLLAGYPEIRMPAVTIAYAMHEVLTALAYLHERHIVHCDVRSDNVLVDERGQVKLADFSSAVYLDADQAAAQKASLGAIYWMAPELARGAGYSGATDVWAAGALLYEMIEGQPPYIEYPDIKVLELAHANGLPRVDPGDACDPRLVDLMRLCTVVAPGERLAASKLRKHEAVAAPNVAQCAQLMVDFVLQVESLEEGESELGGESE